MADLRRMGQLRDAVAALLQMERTEEVENELLTKTHWFLDAANHDSTGSESKPLTLRIPAESIEDVSAQSMLIIMDMMLSANGDV